MSEEKANITVAKHLESLKPIEVASSDRVAAKFMKLYKDIYKEDGNAFYQKERFNFEKLLQENLILQECTKLSLYGAFMEIAETGLSFSTVSKPLCYVMTRNVKVSKPDGSVNWEKRAYVKASPVGEIFIRKREGQIKNADNPVIVWEGDTIAVGLDSQMKRVIKKHETLIPRKENAKILGGYIRIERLDGSFECLWMDISEVQRLKDYSNKQNRGSDSEDKSNKLYTSYNGQIDPGFFEAKIIKNAFDSYPAVKNGQKAINSLREEVQENTLETIETTAQDVTNEPESNSFDSAPDAQQGTVSYEDDGGSF